MVAICYIHVESHCYIYGETFMVGHFLHLQLMVITFVVGITFTVDVYCIYGCYYINFTVLVIYMLTNWLFHASLKIRKTSATVVWQDDILKFCLNLH